ncbi:hypothetical protein [Oceanobacillus massiliensis]|uniref:hypothetical protein n=1 Tax=Oceanobacillus massiliensis TaxID=1465765 RepID=UPI0030178B13
MGFFRDLIGLGDYPNRKEIEQQIDDMVVQLYNNQILENTVKVTGDMIRSHTGSNVGEPRYESIKTNPFMEKFFYDYGLNIFYKGFHLAYAIESGDNSPSAMNKADKIVESYRQEILDTCLNAYDNDTEIAEVFNTVGVYIFDAGMKYGHDYGQQEFHIFEKRK